MVSVTPLNINQKPTATGLLQELPRSSMLHLDPANSGSKKSLNCNHMIAAAIFYIAYFTVFQIPMERVWVGFVFFFFKKTHG